MAENSPILAKTDANNQETGAPKVVNTGDAPRVGQPTQPGLSRGIIKNTTISEMNDSLAHVCDFTLELQKNNRLKIFLKSQAHKIREAIRKIMIALGFSDATGQTSWATETLKSITRELKRFQREVLKPINDFQKLVVEYIKKINDVINWILSLPAKLAAILKDCLAKLYKLIANTFSDLTDGEPTISKDLINAAKETYATSLQTLNATLTTATKVAALPIAVVAMQNKRAP